MNELNFTLADLSLTDFKSHVMSLKKEAEEQTILPATTFASFRFLTTSSEPVDLNNVLHYFEKIPPGYVTYYKQKDKRVIIHGHPVGKPCYASAYCHEYGFWPERIHRPVFKRLFEAKWKKIYDKV